MSAISVAILEEIGFEGLDGITFEALWKRLQERDCFYDHENFYETVWQYILKNDIIYFYQLPEERKPIKIRDRMDEADEEDSKDFYSQNDCKSIKANGEMGFCMFYKERSPIEKEMLQMMSVQEIQQQYGNTFVMVASQEYRESLLFPSNKGMPSENSDTMYVMLEIVGRSRFRGETTNGASSLLTLLKDSRLLFYFKKKLGRMGLITQQLYCRHIPNQGLTRSFLLHLPRFYRENKSIYCQTVEKVVDFLKQRPNYMAPYDLIRAMLENEQIIITPKTFKSKEFSRYIETDIKVPFRQLHPEATEAEYLTKNKQEKRIRVMQLKDPRIDVAAMWLKDEQEADEESFTATGPAKRFFNVPLTRQVYWEIEKSGDRGISQSELGKLLNLTWLQCRALLKNMVKTRIVKVYTADQGRQRLLRYILPKYYAEFKDRLANPAGEESDNELITGGCEESFEELGPQHRDQLFQSLLQTDDVALEDISVEIDEMEEMQKMPRLKLDPKRKLVTVKMVQRVKMVEKLLEKHLIFPDMHRLVRIVVDKERLQGLHEKVCRKTVGKIISTLRSQGKANIFRVTLRSGDVTKVFWYTCAKAVGKDHLLVREAVGRAKSQMQMQKARKEVERGGDAPGDGGEETKRFRMSMKGSAVPKFVRLRLLHEFLFYVIYELPGQSKPLNRDEVLQEWKVKYPFGQDDVPEELPEIYSRDYDWKMFIPPLERYRTYPCGWANLEDLMLRVPFTLIMKMYPNSMPNSGIQEYLTHPIKKNYLLVQLPKEMRLHLMQFRQLSTYIYDLTKKLCYMGLVQMGPQATKSPTSLFLFVNRKAAIIDTSSSAPGYFHIEEKTYPMTMYDFSVLPDVEKYWEELMVVCFATRLGHRKNLEGQEVVVEFAHSKPEMMAALSSRRPLEAIELDQGEIPGDHMGAGGLDSTFHAHIKSSWKGRKMIKKEIRKPVKLPVGTLPKVRKVSSLTRRQPNVISYKAMVRERRLTKTKHVRMISRRPVPPRNRTVFYDETDKRAISMMKTLRVTWTSEEDNLLLLCRIASMYFTGRTKKQYVNSHTIRDILHFHLNSVHKTSKACTRRILYMMRNPSTKTSVESCLCEIQENEMISRKYGENFVENLKKFYSEEELQSAIKHHFINLVAILNQMFYRLSLQGLTRINRSIPDTIEAFWSKFRETNPEKGKLRYVDPVTNEDIVISSIYLLFHSSMCTTKDKAPYNLQLFEVYRNYPNEVLSKAMTRIHKDQLISSWKPASKSKVKKVIPMQAGAFHLSQIYQNQIIQHVPYCIYDEIRQLYARHREDCAELVGNVNGACYLFGELLSQRQINLTFELPKKLLVFSNSTPTDAPYERISSRFHSILSHKPRLEIDGGQDKKAKSQKKVACAPDHDVFIYRQYTFERWMKLPSPECHIFCFLRHAKHSLEKIHNAAFDEVCSFECLFQDGDLTDFLSCIDDIMQTDGRNVDKLLDIFAQITEKIDRRDVKDLGRIRCRRVNVNLGEILRDLIDETSEDQSKWLTEFYQMDENEAEDAIPNTWQIRQDLDANSNIDDFSEKSKRFDNYLTLREVKLSFDIKATAPGCLDDDVREKLLEKVRQSSILINPTKSLEMILISFGGSLENSARRIIDAIIECQQFGTTFTALERRFPDCSSSNLIYILETFLQESIIITIGIVEYHVVFWKYAQPWLIKTFNLTRLEQEAEDPAAALHDAPSTSKQNVEDVAVAEPPPKRPRFSNRAPSISVRNVEALKEKVKGKDREFFYLRPFPWIRVNGTLNRRVLDKWMGSVLIFLTKNPGINVTNLAERFTFLHPTHLRLLLEILEDLQCVQLITVKAPKATLRSCYQSPEIEISHKLAPFDRTVIEILPDALMRYTAFIGERKYRADFI